MSLIKSPSTFIADISSIKGFVKNRLIFLVTSDSGYIMS